MLLSRDIQKYKCFICTDFSVNYIFFIVMGDLESHCLRWLNFEVPIYYRYIDDIFTMVPKNKVDKVLKVFNSYHPRLKFT